MSLVLPFRRAGGAGRRYSDYTATWVRSDLRGPLPGLVPELRVGPDTPPTFFAHADDDRISSENSVTMYLALKRAGVAAELHVYASGGHGFGLRPSDDPCSQWPDRCEQWMRSRGLLEKQ